MIHIKFINLVGHPLRVRLTMKLAIFWEKGDSAEFYLKCDLSGK
jgi:hypothetical protein